MCGPSAVTAVVHLPQRDPEQWFCPPSLRLCFLFPLGSLGKETLGIPIPGFAENIFVKSVTRTMPHPACCESRGRSTAGFLPGSLSSWGRNTAHVHLLFLYLERLGSHCISCLNTAEGLRQGGCCPPGHLRGISRSFSTAAGCLRPAHPGAHCALLAPPQITWSGWISLVLCFPGTKGPDVSWVSTEGRPLIHFLVNIPAGGIWLSHEKNKLFFWFFLIICSGQTTLFFPSPVLLLQSCRFHPVFIIFSGS